jgi:iron complex transport system substrate-binding protein
MLRPGRVVSLNLCTDQLLLSLADTDQVAAVTFLATDPDLSAEAERARRTRTIQATAEEVLLLNPDLVLAGLYGTQETVALLHSLGVRVEEFAPAGSFAEIQANILRAGALLGVPERARKVLEEMEAQLRIDVLARPLSALAFGPGGLVFGKGTLDDEILVRAGLVNLAGVMGIQSFGFPDLEQLVVGDPDLLIVPGYRTGAPTLAELRMSHPALQGRARSVSVPYAWLACGSASTALAVRLVAEAAAAPPNPFSDERRVGLGDEREGPAGSGRRAEADPERKGDLVEGRR